MSLFGKDATSFSHLDLGILCHSSLQILSSSVRLAGKHWWTAIFRSLQRCSIGFKSLAGSFKNNHGVVVKPVLRYFSGVLRVIVLLEGEPSAQSEVQSTLENVCPGYACTWPHLSFPRLQPVVLSLQLKTVRIS